MKIAINLRKLAQMAIVRNTKSSRILMDVFKNTQRALSVVDLVSRFKEEMNKTTIYRILEKLEKQGFVHSFTGLDGLKWYAKCHDCDSHKHIDAHPHFQCQSCQKIDCLSESISIPKLEGRKVDFAQVLLVGKCGDCTSN